MLPLIFIVLNFVPIQDPHPAPPVVHAQEALSPPQLLVAAAQLQLLPVDVLFHPQLELPAELLFTFTTASVLKASLHCFSDNVLLLHGDKLLDYILG